MNNFLQMIMQSRFQQMPQQLMSQLESQLKRVNPQAYQEFQQARKNNMDPNEFLNKTINNFNPQQRQQWNNMMGQFNQQNKQD